MNKGLDEETLESIRRAIREEVRLALGPGPGPSVDASSAPRPLEGDVRYFRLPELLQLVSLQRLTGRLSMRHEGQSVEVYMRRGQVAFAAGDKRGEPEQLGQFLMNMGRLSKAALEDALERCSKTGDRLGMSLVKSGHASADDIKAVLEKQTERSVYRAMAWGDGRFAFELCEMPGFVEDMPIALPVEGLILEGVRRIEEGRLIAEKIPSLDIVFTKPAYSPEELDGLRLKPDEKAVLGMVDGRRDIKELIGASGMAEYGFLRAAYTIYSAGIIRKREPSMKTGRTQYL